MPVDYSFIFCLFYCLNKHALSRAFHSIGNVFSRKRTELSDACWLDLRVNALIFIRALFKSHELFCRLILGFLTWCFGQAVQATSELRCALFEHSEFAHRRSRRTAKGTRRAKPRPTWFWPLSLKQKWLGCRDEPRHHRKPFGMYGMKKGDSRKGLEKRRRGELCICT